ncbi:restriction endonuclease subunit S [Streptomyces fradiae]|uniref:restriction endonuclease subunit S n=1 Tax=Streptomyces fradiae TaxID=1906 RepID=UPI00201841B2|nr:restriction endonuclease subunit S [Streptomyces fradiae]UQS28118.1 restriction endonuclease subunit S [Streptomyces fradiae]
MSTDAEIRWVPVREVGEVRMGKQLSPSSKEAPGQFPYLRVANVLHGRIDYSDVNFMGFSSAERETYSLRPGDILLNEGQSLGLVGRSAIYDGADGKYCYQNTLVRFRPSRKVLPEYAQIIFEWWLAAGVFAAIAKQTTSIAHLGGDRFGALLFPLRPIPEQRRIVEVIDAVAVQERAIESSVAKLKTLKAAATESLLMQMSWESTLQEAIEGPPRNGYSPVESDAWTGVQMLGLGCLTKGGFSPVQLKNAPSEQLSSHWAVLSDGELLMSRANTRELVGLVGVYRDIGTPCLYPDLMMRIRPSLRCSAEFLSIVLRSDRSRRAIQAMAQGTSESMVKISAGSVRDLPVPIPSVDEQRRVLGVAAAFDVELRQLEVEMAKLRRLKVGLVDQLLTGGV